ncbi:hypothetical protein tb265_35170 [Gemmatimonadetes bacterium T265]|nr:hypothetical protein tb265_35170 [Gemmatimonadetes bacterium T265]
MGSDSYTIEAVRRECGAWAGGTRPCAGVSGRPQMVHSTAADEPRGPVRRFRTPGGGHEGQLGVYAAPLGTKPITFTPEPRDTSIAWMMS